MNIENVVLGCILIDRSIHEIVIPILKPEYFTGKRDGFFKAMVRMYKAGEPIDQYTIIKKIGINHKFWTIGDVTALSDLVASTANVMGYIQELKFEYQKRILSTKYGLQIGYDTDPMEVISGLLNDLDILQQDGVICQNRDIVTIVDEALKSIDVEKTQTGMIGIPTSLGAINSDTKGLRAGELIVIAGRPGHGKTAFVLSLAKAACLHGKSVVMFTLEMLDTELAKRMIRSYENDQNGADDISRMKLNIFDKGGIDIDFIRSNVRLIRNVDMVIIDYLGLMKTNLRVKRSEAIGEITRQLKAFALETNTVVVLVSQLNRDIESRSGWQHKLSDLRESGDIEQDADKVIFINSPKVLSLDEVDINGQTIDTEGLTIIQKLKDRNGKAPVFYKARHNETYSEFYDYSASTDRF